MKSRFLLHRPLCIRLLLLTIRYMARNTPLKQAHIPCAAFARRWTMPPASLPSTSPPRLRLPNSSRKRTRKAVLYPTLALPTKPRCAGHLRHMASAHVSAPQRSPVSEPSSWARAARVGSVFARYVRDGKIAAEPSSGTDVRPILIHLGLKHDAKVGCWCQRHPSRLPPRCQHDAVERCDEVHAHCESQVLLLICYVRLTRRLC